MPTTMERSNNHNNNNNNNNKYRKDQHYYSSNSNNTTTLLESLHQLNLSHTHSTDNTLLTLQHSQEMSSHHQQRQPHQQPLHNNMSSMSLSTHPYQQQQQQHSQHVKKSSSSSSHKRKNRIEQLYHHAHHANSNSNQNSFHNNNSNNNSFHNNNSNHTNTTTTMNGYCPSLSWRLDPDESLSDWTLTVVAVHQNQETNQQPNDKDHHQQQLSQSLSGDGSRSFYATTTTTSSTLPPLSSSSSASAFSTPTPAYSKKYFVHRTQLGVGPRKSEYFCKLFQAKSSRQQQTLSSSHSHHQQQQQQQQHSTTTGSPSSSSLPTIGKTRIELHPLAADAFPIMLDFMYSPVGTPPNVTTETAVALRQLATSFGIRELFDAVTDFIQHDIVEHVVETAPLYLAHADIFRQDKLVQVALKACAEHFEHIKFGPLAQFLHPALFERVIESPDLECSSEVLSARVAAYCRCRPGSVDSAMLQRITDARLMPRIAPEESLFYLRLLEEIMADGGGDHHHDSSDRGKSLAHTSDLYKRCVEHCHDTIRNALLAEKTMTTQERSKSADSRQTRNNIMDYRKLPDWIKVDVLESALVKCPSPEEVRALELAKAKSQERHASETAVQVAYLNSELDKLHKMYEKKIASYQATLRAQEQELRAYLAELSKFVRVPNHHRVTPLLSEYTYQRRQEIDEYGESIYGEVPPDDLPRFLPPEEDGWVLHEEVLVRNNNNGEHHDTQCWPMYYYKGDFQLKS